MVASIIRVLDTDPSAHGWQESIVGGLGGNMPVLVRGDEIVDRDLYRIFGETTPRLRRDSTT